MTQIRPKYMPIVVRENGLLEGEPDKPYTFASSGSFKSAFEVVECIYLKAGAIEVLAQIADAALADWSTAKCLEHTYKFFQFGVFPQFIVDRTRTGVRYFGIHLRPQGQDYSPESGGRRIHISGELVDAAEKEGSKNLIPSFKLIHAISHEIAHVFLSYCFWVSANEGGPPQMHTPPKLNYLDRYGKGKEIGEAGYYMDRYIWGGAVFYPDMTSHANGQPSVFRHEDNPKNIWVQISDAKLIEIIFMCYTTSPSIPIIRYLPEDGQMLVADDGDIPKDLKPRSVPVTTPPEQHVQDRRKRKSRGSAAEEPPPKETTTRRSRYGLRKRGV
ncbi:hypothetical protein TWF281_008952 [Arthrobotrys megalospora]